MTGPFVPCCVARSSRRLVAAVSITWSPRIRLRIASVTPWATASRSSTTPSLPTTAAIELLPPRSIVESKASRPNTAKWNITVISRTIEAPATGSP
jgi:hypothetical protein